MPPSQRPQKPKFVVPRRNAEIGRTCYAPSARRSYGGPVGRVYQFRAELNEEILNCGHQGIKRFFALDHQTYEPGVLDTKTKELLELVASAVLRCDDCITYHLVKAGEAGWTARK